MTMVPSSNKIWEWVKACGGG